MWNLGPVELYKYIARSKLNRTRALLKMRSKIIIMKTDMFRTGKSLTLIGYGCGLPEMDEVDELYQSYDLPHKNHMTPDTALSFGGCYMI